MLIFLNKSSRHLTCYNSHQLISTHTQFALPFGFSTGGTSKVLVSVSVGFSVVSGIGITGWETVLAVEGATATETKGAKKT